MQLNLPKWIHTHTHTRLTALCPGLPRWAGTRKVKPNWILVKQETVSGSGIGWAICKSAHCSRQIATPAPHLPKSIMDIICLFPFGHSVKCKTWISCLDTHNQVPLLFILVGLAVYVCILVCVHWWLPVTGEIFVQCQCLLCFFVITEVCPL